MLTDECGRNDDIRKTIIWQTFVVVIQPRNINDAKTSGPKFDK